MFPQDEAGFGVDDQFYLGSAGLLVKPITQEGVTSTDIYISDDQVGDSLAHRDLILSSNIGDILTTCSRTTTISHPTCS
jgi:hypothetical protein